MTMGCIAAILLGFLFSALFSGIETGSYKINRIRLRRRERDRQPAALALARLLRRPYLFIYTVLIGNNIANYVLSKQVTDLYLLALAVRRGGRFVTFDDHVPLSAVVGAAPESLYVL